MHPVHIYWIVTSLGSASIAFIMTAYVPYLLSLGLSLSDVTLLNACFLVSIFFLEIPTGLFADGRSRAWSVKIGFFVRSLSLLAYAGAMGFKSALAAEVLAGFGNAFISGAFQAWLTDSVKVREPEHNLRKTFALGSTFTALASLVAAVIGTYISLVSPRYSWLMGAVTSFIAWMLACRWMNGKDGEVPVHERLSEKEALRATVRMFRANPAFRWGAAVAVAFGLVMPFNYYWAPFFQSRAGQHALAWIWPCLYVPLVISGLLVRYGVRRVRSDAVGLVLALCFSGAGLALIWMFGGVAIPIVLVMFHEIGRGMYDPYAGAFFQARFERANRATAGSVQSFIQTCGWASILFMVTFATRGAPGTERMMTGVWTVCGSLLVAIGMVAYLLRPHDITSRS